MSRIDLKADAWERRTSVSVGGNLLPSCAFHETLREMSTGLEQCQRHLKRRNSMHAIPHNDWVIEVSADGDNHVTRMMSRQIRPHKSHILVLTLQKNIMHTSQYFCSTVCPFICKGIWT